MSGKNIDAARLKVTIEASAAPYKKEMEKAKQISKSVTSSINKELKKVKSPLESMTSGNKALNSIKSFQQKLKKSLSSISGKDVFGGMKERAKQFQLNSGIKVYSDDYLRLTADIDKAEKALQKLEEKEQKMIALGTAGDENATWKSLQYDIQKAEDALESYNQEKRKMERSGTDVQRPQSIGSSLGGLAKSAITKGWGGMTRAFGGMKAILNSVAPAIRKASGVFGALIQKFKTGIPFLNKAKSSFNGLGTSGKGLSGILQTVGMTAKFMFASFLIRGALDGTKEGFKNLAQYSDSTNRSISVLMSSLTQLKNALAAAFAPILNIISPILDFFIQKVISVVNSLGQLTSALTGNGVYIRAKKVNQDYAASLQDNTKNANKAQQANEKLRRTLLGFDQINKMDDNSHSGSSGDEGKSSLGGLSVGDMFETVQIQNKFQNLAKQIKEAWNNADFTEIGSIVGRKLNSALSNIPWEGIQNTCNRIAKSAATFLNGFLLITDWNRVGITIANGLNIAFGIADIFTQNFNWNSFGQAVGSGINGSLGGLDWELIFSTIHNTVSGVIGSLNSFIQTADWQLIGTSLSQFWNATLEILYTSITEFDWKETADALSQGINSAVNTFDWGKAGKTISDGIKGLLDFGIRTIRQTDWKQLGEQVKTFLENIDWNGIADRAFELLGSALGGLGSFLGGLIGEKVQEAKSFFAEAVELCGGHFITGLFYGITTALGNVVTWIKDHIFSPFINGFKEVFGINSPSTVMAEMGGFLMEGLLNGINGLVEDVLGLFTNLGESITESEIWTNITTTLSETWENLKTTASEKFADIKTSVSDTWDEVKETASEKWETIKNSLSGIWDWLRGKSEDDFPEIEKSAAESFGNTEETAGSTWSNSQTAVTDALNSMKSETSQKMRQVFKNVESYTNSIYNITINNWEAIGKKVAQVLGDMNTDAEAKLNSLAGMFSNLGSSIKSNLSNLYGTGRNAAQSFANGFTSVHIPTPHLYTSSWTRHYTNADKTAWYSTPNYSVSWYAAGGFPSAGEMFIARENGPELVGRMGNRNTVANNNQIVEGIKAGVFEAVLDAFQASGLLNRDGSETQVVVEFTFMADGEVLYKIVRKGQKKYDNRYHIVETV